MPAPLDAPARLGSARMLPPSPPRFSGAPEVLEAPPQATPSVAAKLPSSTQDRTVITRADRSTNPQLSRRGSALGRYARDDPTRRRKVPRAPSIPTARGRGGELAFERTIEGDCAPACKTLLAPAMRSFSVLA